MFNLIICVDTYLSHNHSQHESYDITGLVDNRNNTQLFTYAFLTTSFNLNYHYDIYTHFIAH